jgi:hypothetical protein
MMAIENCFKYMMRLSEGVTKKEPNAKFGLGKRIQ